MKPIVGFQLNLEMAEEFFLRCMDRKANTLPEREAILRELVKEYKAIGLNEDDLRRKLSAKRVMRIKSKDNKNRP